MFEYLVTSRARRELLRRLWLHGDRASISALARACGVSFAAAHRELEAMKAAGLAVAEREGLEAVYRAERRHPEADVLTSLLSPHQRSQEPDERQPSASAEDALAESLVLAHANETVALAIPAALWRQRDQLDYRRLAQAAARRDQRQTLGFYLQLTGRLGGDLRLVRQARPLRDRRRTVLRPFFSGAHDGGWALPLARRWGFLLNVELERFAAAFTREARTQAPAASGRSSLLSPASGGSSSQ
jgi:DNA-binding transcriptional ArsR family regulator